MRAVFLYLYLLYLADWNVLMTSFAQLHTIALAEKMMKVLV